MTTVLIHGNPETDAIWTDLVGELTDRNVADLVPVSYTHLTLPTKA